MELLNKNILNVTLLEPRMKHPTIFARFDELHEGESLTIHNDHDPKPLYYQLLGERGNIFNWEYQEQGPEWWKVSITKRKYGEADETLGQIAAKDLRKVEVFKKYRLDFCCNGKKTVKEACAEKGLDVTKIENELQQADKAPVGRPIPYNDWSPEFLAEYIVNTHHAFVRKVLPEMVTYAEKVMKVHGARHPELLRVYQLVAGIEAELGAHLVKEEKVLFPYIKELSIGENAPQSLRVLHLGSVRHPINLMEMEHEVVAEHLEEIKKLTNNYSLPQDACATYNLLFNMLREFEEDLNIHVHLENNILFPKALAIEKKRSDENE